MTGRVSDTAMLASDIRDEIKIHAELKADFQRLQATVKRLFDSFGGSNATRDRLQELSERLSDLAPNWQLWENEIDEVRGG